MYTGASAMAFAGNFQRSQDTLYALAADTGGKAMFDYNDLSMGIVQAQKALSSYYVIGYYSTNTAMDGKFRRVKIEMKEIQGQARLPPGLLRSEGLLQIHDRRQGTPA